MMGDLLEITEGKDALVERMLQQKEKEKDGAQPAAQPVLHIVPTPGFCLKARTKAGEKLFVNVCTSDKVPLARDITDKELESLISDPEKSSPYRIPMSIGEPHGEEDKAGGSCTAYDVIVHPDFLARAKTRFLLEQFFLTLVMEGIANKYSLDIAMQWVVLKNRKKMGELKEQFVRSAARPAIVELERGAYAEPSKAEEISLTAQSSEKKKSLGKCPEYRIVQDPPAGHPDFLVAEVQLPLIKSAASLALDVGGDRLVLATRSLLYHLDIFLPFELAQDDCGAQFNRKTRVLTITMPVEPAR